MFALGGGLDPIIYEFLGYLWEEAVSDRAFGVVLMSNLQGFPPSSIEICCM